MGKREGFGEKRKKIQRKRGVGLVGCEGERSQLELGKNFCTAEEEGGVKFKTIRK